MKELLERLDAWRRDGVRVGRAMVIRTYGSAPRPEGASLLYSEDGRIAGSVSGGCVEGAAAEEIAKAFESGASKVVSYGISDEQAWSVGLACGGNIDVLIEPEIPDEAESAARSAGGVAVVTDLADGHRFTVSQSDPANASADVVAAARESLLRGSSRVFESGTQQFFIEAYPVRPRLVIVGAVEIGRSLDRLAHELGFATVVVDGRAAFATTERFPDADRLVVGWLDEVADDIALDANDAVAVLAHDPKLDDPALAEAFRRGCRYVGALGSRKTQGDRRERLRGMGVSEDDLNRLHGPIGLDLGGKSPAETALAILAQVVAERYGASGGAKAAKPVPAG
ncbi:MAG TPA: XdhC/CoxI family protein [Candidatus Limnocylindria bacterium]|nr:XdhC/CoxI family protein [Candidatus Limnocylindria bacterium]